MLQSWAWDDIAAPKWIEPQLTRLVDEAPAGDGWVHEIKYDSYRMHARIDGGKAKLLTCSGLDRSHRYRRTVEALQRLPAITRPLASPWYYDRYSFRTDVR
ncbi:hypothetical protein [Reyranella soli]|uniref:ATP-dependent DNA ligase family profile domain-containing protein n=1 Tax=Reyranella soli TaxID=1230389 RepID=A0A512NKE0_9HYPH|nr:hypothetical protein [Reyranella soli]GEP59414.1 hypothetical protein RSO01_65800 [Reyranella soli]